MPKSDALPPKTTTTSRLTTLADLAKFLKNCPSYLADKPCPEAALCCYSRGVGPTRKVSGGISNLSFENRRPRRSSNPDKWQQVQLELQLTVCDAMKCFRRLLLALKKTFATQRRTHQCQMGTSGRERFRPPLRCRPCVRPLRVNLTKSASAGFLHLNRCKRWHFAIWRETEKFPHSCLEQTASPLPLPNGQ